MDRLSQLVRPLATIAFVAAFLGYAHVDPSAFDHIKDTAIMVVAYWFGTRSSTDSKNPTT